MKKSIVLFLLLFIYGLTPSLVSISSDVSAAQHTDWKNVAVKETKKRYPLSQVLFAQKIWDNTKKNQTVKQYKVTVREGMKDIGVFVTISYDAKTEKVKKIQVLEEAD
ncbi:DUF3889 domain-containing protein [Peribacillus frigoritolerans]|uniref:DUF3889 domain-containing protein n=1 Tax=Peribacillus frigoritolerans TaxID=450367 RepID=UPI00105A2BD1|nr:DUF3889 domain-containing protein [Peribacillus frigoritolerans]TDL82322.1 DUF3889 domain-containing protein [Peribacillus frigoritolerans]